ncbi:hypothetical protein M2152_002221 [Microbacteriaceae bacterium SG_E_30_P1]|uniref:AlgX/AlgJ SGNH hydrolase-like domain-containing protein n=1 Tax=Antiquaquibacter oligotrophicus TaxID=2880260 RepID=A0ABT6KPY0_9MICO|nr:hypothetical protein [Antiquaquibacter oligotrophicus]MDH6182039.1 hypothetical protein [Antiquaquibacter oligotrophicus]UDF12293.1 hypothetical protein LH407_08965 [Antiquaquibacter oligotrophicus]
MSLRELPPEQTISSRWTHLRYVPLVILVVLVVVATGVGLWARSNQAAPPTPDPAGTPAAPVAQRLPDVCRTPTEVPSAAPWSADNAGASEAVWNEHAEETANVVLGQDRWVFWGDLQNNNFSQALGRRTLSAEELESWRSYIANLDTTLTEAGIEFYVVIAPAKWAIYPEELPTWAESIRGPGPLDQLMAAGGDLPLIDLRESLREASAETQTFSRYNSHWTSFGALTGWNTIAECLNANEADLAITPNPIDGVTLVEDYNEFGNYGVELEEADWTEPVFTPPLAPIELTIAGGDPSTIEGNRWTTFDDMPALSRNESAATDASVLFAGDSFGIIMSPYYQQAFREVRTLRHNLDADPSERPDIAELALATRPDIVILEIAQRHLNRPPTP